MEWKFIEVSRAYPGIRGLLCESIDGVFLTYSIEGVDKQPGQYPRVTIQISIQAKGDFTKPNKKLPRGRKPQRVYYNLSILTLRTDGFLVDSRRIP